MGLWRSAGGTVTLRMTSAEIPLLLQIFAQQGIVLYGIIEPDPLTAEFVVQRKDYPAIKAITDNRGDDLDIIQRSGFFWRLKALGHRPLLIAGLLSMFFLAVILPMRVLFIQVEGNERIPAALIEEKAAQCGICFWASRAEVRSERVKNRLLEVIPELQWVGVNTTGCRAIISVRERVEKRDGEEEYPVSRIVACRDGVVSSVVCTAGSVMCSPGQAVLEGQTLISGFTDCGLSIRAERAQGEIFAFTNRKIRAILPVDSLSTEDITHSGGKISFIIGKKRINLWKDSGISCTTCVKIYEEKWVCLPGGFRLPVCVVVERQEGRNKSESALVSEPVLAEYARRYLSSQMLSGTILNKSEEITEQEACLVLSGRYECLEMIGRERGEEIVHGKDN